MDDLSRYAQSMTFGLLPEPEGRRRSFVTATVINGMILALILYIGATARRVIDQHLYEQTVLIIPNTPPEPTPKVKPIEPPKPIERPKLAEVKYEAPKIKIPRPEPKPDLKPIVMEAKLNVPAIRAPRLSVVEAPQPKAVALPMPAQVPQTRVSTAAVHLGETFGVKPNPNATRPATIAAIGNPYGGMNGAAIAPHGVVGSTGIGNGIKPGGSNTGSVRKVASAGIPTGTSSAGTTNMGKVASAGIPTMTAAVVIPRMTVSVASTNLEVLSKPPVLYPDEAKQLKVQGDVILRVTFTAAGQVLVQKIVHGLGHGLDEEARRVAEQIRFRPATQNGKAVDMTTNITISFQLA